MKHTELPWRQKVYDGENEYSGKNIVGKDEYGKDEYICTTSGRAIANAEYIVKAANNLPECISAIEDLLEAFRGAIYECDAQEEVEKAEKLLKELGEL